MVRLQPVMHICAILRLYRTPTTCTMRHVGCQGEKEDEEFILELLRKIEHFTYSTPTHTCLYLMLHQMTLLWAEYLVCYVRPFRPQMLAVVWMSCTVYCAPKRKSCSCKKYRRSNCTSVGMATGSLATNYLIVAHYYFNAYMFTKTAARYTGSTVVFVINFRSCSIFHPLQIWKVLHIRTSMCYTILIFLQTQTLNQKKWRMFFRSRLSFSKTFVVKTQLKLHPWPSVFTRPLL